MRSNHSRVAIIGAGSGGHTTLAQLVKSGFVNQQDITVFDPSEEHHYQSAYTMVAGGVLGNAQKAKDQQYQKVVRPQQEMFGYSPQVNWRKESVLAFNPDQNAIELSDGTQHTYDYLIVAPGLKLRYDQIAGAQEALADPDCPVGSMYTLNGAYKASVLRDNFRGGNAIFTQAPFPIKCGGAPQKMLYLSEETFRKNGVREQTNLKFFAATPCLFPPQPDYNAALNPILASKEIQPYYKHVLQSIDKDNRVAIFTNLDTQEQVRQDFDFLHVVPPQSAPDFVASSSLAAPNGYLDVNPGTLQHSKYANIFGIGDIANLATSKTASAIFSQAPVVVHNLLREMGCQNSKNQAIYDGYSACPVFVGDKKLMLAEFKYGQEHAETFFADQTVPRKIFYQMKKNVFPAAYFNLVPRGMWFGSNMFFKPIY